MSNISIIVAVADNNTIGVNGDLPWDLPGDLKNFKKKTKGHTVIMGRKCWESIPNKFRPLPNRTNVVLTRNSDYELDNVEVRNDLEKAILEFSELGDVFIIGGSDIYKESFKYANKLHITRVNLEVEGDTFLEGLNETDWVMTAFEGPFNENDIHYHFEEYRKKEE